jgi:hypothetical protein
LGGNRLKEALAIYGKALEYASQGQSFLASIQNRLQNSQDGEWNFVNGLKDLVGQELRKQKIQLVVKGSSVKSGKGEDKMEGLQKELAGLKVGEEARSKKTGKKVCFTIS